MPKPQLSELTWSEIGRSTSSDKKNIVRAEVKLDEYYVVIGFEVNKPELAFKNQIHDLSGDYGHAFFYVVKNKLVTKVFSFGPAANGKIGWFNSDRAWGIKDGSSNSRQGTPDYAIQEDIRAFRIKLNLNQGIKLERVTEDARKEIIKGDQEYTAFLNDTCAETARETLSDAGIKTPLGMGRIKKSSIINFPVVYGVNPYKWHHDFQEEGKFEVLYKVSKDTIWRPPVGDLDPIFGNIP